MNGFQGGAILPEHPMLEPGRRVIVQSGVQRGFIDVSQQLLESGHVGRGFCVILVEGGFGHDQIYQRREKEGVEKQVAKRQHREGRATVAEETKMPRINRTRV